MEHLSLLTTTHSFCQSTSECLEKVQTNKNQFKLLGERVNEVVSALNTLQSLQLAAQVLPCSENVLQNLNNTLERVETFVKQERFSCNNTALDPEHFVSYMCQAFDDQQVFQELNSLLSSHLRDLNPDIAIDTLDFAVAAAQDEAALNQTFGLHVEVAEEVSQLGCEPDIVGDIERLRCCLDELPADLPTEESLQMPDLCVSDVPPPPVPFMLPPPAPGVHTVVATDTAVLPSLPPVPPTAAEVALTHKRVMYANGDVYDGQYKHDHKEGRGVMKYSNGDVYDGRWVENKREGYGVCKHADKSVYDGPWHCDKREGHGILKSADGSTFTGEWIDDKRKGYGVCIYANGDVYDGQWKDNKIEGQGVLTTPDGIVYDGHWKAGCKDGHGVMKYADGSNYSGHWVADKYNGHGTYSSPDGSVYDGNYADNHRVGHGVQRYSDGSVYTGNWQHDHREGMGVLQSIHGTYDGLWKAETMEGHGVYKYTNGDSYHGLFKLGKKEGHGVMKYANGDAYVGGWKDDKKEGHGVLKLADGSVQHDGQWADDQKC